MVNNDLTASLCFIFKSRIKPLLVIFSVIILTSCQQADPDIIRFGIATAPKQLDPRLATDAVSSRVNRLLYQRLVDFDDHFQVIPSLASWQQISPTHYRFQLKNNAARFSNGQRLTTADVKATYNSILDPKTASPHRTSIEMIQKIKIIDSETIDFILSREEPQFPAYLVMGILPKDLIEQQHSFTKHPIGSGLFEFVQRFNHEVVIKRRKDGQKFRFVVDRNPTVRVLKLQKGEIDLLQNNLPPEMIFYLKKQSDIKLIESAGSNFSYLGFQFEDPITANLLIRQAIGHAINRKLIVKTLIPAQLASAFFPPQHWLGLDLEPLQYDPALAKKLLQKAGYNQQHILKLTYKTSTDPLRIRIATVIQDQLKNIGIDLKIQSYDWGTFFGDIKSGRFQMYSLTWVGVKTPDIFRYVYHSDSFPPKGANRGRYSSKKLDHFIEDAEKITVTSDLKQAYQTIQSYIFKNLIVVPLWYENNYVAMRDRIKGYQLALDGNYDSLKNVILRKK